jgi:hypothetical protein
MKTHRQNLIVSIALLCCLAYTPSLTPTCQASLTLPGSEVALRVHAPGRSPIWLPGIASQWIHTTSCHDLARVGMCVCERCVCVVCVCNRLKV